MKERPILFNDEMEIAILDDRKTQTRRPIEPQPKYAPHAAYESYPLKPTVWCSFTMQELSNGDVDGEIGLFNKGASGAMWSGKCPYGKVGDRDALIDGREIEIVNVRVERLQDISRGEAMSEGCPFPNLNGKEVGFTDPVNWFRELWDGIYCGNEYAWDKNPWVWVISFRRVEL